MSKLPPFLAFAAVSSLLLVGCSSTPAGAPAAPPTTTASESATPSATPTPEETESAEPEETVEPSREPSEEPSPEPTPEAPETEAPAPEPVPTTPADPFVPPPHGEPNPGPFVPPPHGEPNPGPFVPPPHGEPNPHQSLNGQGGSVAYPQPGFPGPSIVITPGTFTIGGTGYAPGEKIHVALGRPHTDQQLLDQPYVYAGPDGSFTFNIQVAPELAGGEYIVLTWAPERGGQAAEESKRYLSVSVVS